MRFIFLLLLPLSIFAVDECRIINNTTAIVFKTITENVPTATCPSNSVVGPYSGTVDGVYYSNYYISYEYSNCIYYESVDRTTTYYYFTDCNPCNDGEIYDSATQSCVPYCDTVPPPAAPAGMTQFGIFTSESECSTYAENVGFFNYSCQIKSPECPSWYGFADMSDGCDDFSPPPSFNGKPFQGYYPTLSWCIEAYQLFSVDGTGYCEQFPPCTKFFAYYERPDNSSSDPGLPGDTPSGDLPPDSTTADTSATDDNNDGIDMNPLLDQLDRIAQQNHNDLTSINSRLGGGIDSIISELSEIHFQNAVTNKYLSDAIGTLGGQNININVDTTGVESKLDSINNTLNQEGPELPDSTFIDDFISSVSDQFTSLKDQIYAVEGVMTGDLPSVSLPSGSAPVYSIDYHGQTVSFDLCASFATFKPILTFIFTFVFMILSVRIGWSSIKIAFMGGS